MPVPGSSSLERRPPRAAIFFACLIVLAAWMGFSSAASTVPDITALETEWINRGLMGPGEISRHRVNVDRRAREARHAVSIHGEEAHGQSRIHSLDAAACEDFFIWLEKQRPDRWKDDYSVPMLDGWAWTLRIGYRDAPEKRVKGNGTLPPGGQELRQRIRALAPFDPGLRIF